MAVPRVSKADFKRELPALRDELLDLQVKLHNAKSCAVAVIVVGTPAAGRSETVNALLEWLDPKHIGVHAYDRPKQEYPALWPYWQNLPARGRMTFFFAGWYGDYLQSAIHDHKRQRDKRPVERILQLERMLVKDQVRVIKLYLHTDQDTQQRRIHKLRADKLTRWRVTHEDRWQAKHFDRVQRAMRACLKMTDHEAAPWHSIDGTDEEYRLLAVAKILRDELRDGLKERPSPAKAASKSASRPQSKKVPLLQVEQVEPVVDDDEYARQLETLQGRFARLVRKSSFRKHGLVLAFEGMDAAGKGGAIRRVTYALDARQYQVVPVSAPTPEERSYPYLWRFWRHIPALGSVTIFDRTWYGRVLVERVRGFAAETDWKRAYDEIVEFERQLTEQGLFVAKFWLSVSPEEQLRRFNTRDEDPLKRFKVDPEDWENRKYYDAYQMAAAEMVQRTDRDDAKWTIVPADDKRRARLIVLESICRTLEGQ